MLLQRIYRWRLVMTLFLLVFFGITEYAESGLFRRCRLRLRRIRPVVRQLKYSRTVYQPDPGPGPIPAPCVPGSICPISIIAKYYDDSGNCLYTSYNAKRCPLGSVHIDAPCDDDLTLPTYCYNCKGCFGGPISIPIPIPVDPDAPNDPDTRDKVATARYYSRELAKRGTPAGGVMKAGDSHEAEQLDGRQGVVIELRLEDDNGEAAGTKNVHLDWFKPKKGMIPRGSHGVGYETTDAPYGPAKLLLSERLDARVYSLLVNYQGKKRHYVVYLP